ncbi:MAG TPA: nucleoside 2-deoxyribosyltransferase [Candidatus Saccharimonadales bacterium]|nr:nucleoside 2-deoxyribosyltransferase [Candidatus Saccharimonadales bacterium]
MKVHLITSRPTLEKDIITLRKMISIIQQTGHSLAYDWIEGAYERSQKPGVQYADWSKVYKENLEVINKADVVIAETSHENFGVGYQVAFAVQQKKPVLLLLHEQADKNAFATGVEEGWVKREEYTEENLEGIMQKFLADNDIQAKDMRFNFFIDRPIYNYLRWAAYKTGKTKAEILRDLVSKEIEKSNDINQL